ncbi:hypothetical protein L6452_41177 [Arctium lappa]|uniref:Uncharacterized protein n=1 Tax=Arctium lappa TaxID=4217 RepID=A0ACB8XP30_ARCLA|nr:hypothetical protein L6452_41177 [Arctium lappa]
MAACSFGASSLKLHDLRLGHAIIELPNLQQNLHGGRILNLRRFDDMVLSQRSGKTYDHIIDAYRFEVYPSQSLLNSSSSSSIVINKLLDWSFDWTYMVRGLVLDKKRGNILKMDRHKYVKVAYHGFRLLPKDEKVAAYGNTLVREAFNEPGYALIDTLFSLAEAYLFAQLVLDYISDKLLSLPGRLVFISDWSSVPTILI